jgi:hypothetical protein
VKRVFVRMGIGLLVMACVFLVLRAIVEVFTVHPTNPGSYRHDWGGPTLIGVYGVHLLPGIAAGFLLVAMWRRRERHPRHPLKNPDVVGKAHVLNAVDPPEDRSSADG